MTDREKYENFRLEELRKLAGARLSTEGKPTKIVTREGKPTGYVQQYGDRELCLTILCDSSGTQQPAEEPEPVKVPLPVDTMPVVVKAALPVGLPAKKNKCVLPNGRNGKSLPDAGKWFAQILPLRHITHPAWKALSKSATDVVIICIAKASSAAHMNRKGKDGVPIFNFTVSEGESIFKMPRPTFTKAIGLAIEIGFIECIKQGGITDGAGIMAVYRLSEKWKSYQAPVRDNTNINKARLAKKQIPSKAALNAVGKVALTGNSAFLLSVGKGALTDNPYFPS